jgi:hypothetical protein
VGQDPRVRGGQKEGGHGPAGPDHHPPALLHVTTVRWSACGPCHKAESSTSSIHREMEVVKVLQMVTTRFLSFPLFICLHRVRVFGKNKMVLALPNSTLLPPWQSAIVPCSITNPPPPQLGFVSPLSRGFRRNILFGGCWGFVLTWPKKVFKNESGFATCRDLRSKEGK